MKDFKESDFYKNTSENKLEHIPIDSNELNELDAAMEELDEKGFNMKKETINEYYSRIFYKQNSNSAVDFTQYLPYKINFAI